MSRVATCKPLQVAWHCRQWTLDTVCITVCCNLIRIVPFFILHLSYISLFFLPAAHSVRLLCLTVPHRASLALARHSSFLQLLPGSFILSPENSQLARQAKNSRARCSQVHQHCFTSFCLFLTPWSSCYSAAPIDPITASWALYTGHLIPDTFGPSCLST